MSNLKLTNFRNKLLRVGCMAMIAMSGTALSTVGAQSQSLTQVEFDGAKSRVNLSGRLRMLNEQIAGAACRVSANIDGEQARRDLVNAKVEFGQIMKALRESDATIGVPTPENRARVLSKIWSIELQWVEVKYAIDQIMRDIRVAEYIDVISRLTAPDALAQNLSNMESEIVAEYTNPNELLTGDALTISLVARQRKITQEISKLTCAQATGQEKFGNQQDLESKMDLFDRSLSALENGFPAAGISKPPTPFITGRLNSLRFDWSELSVDAIDAASSVASVSSKTVQYNVFNKEISNLVALYMLSTQGQDDLYTVPLKAYAEFQLTTWLDDPALIAAVEAQNARHTTLTAGQIDQLDKQWRAEVDSNGEKPLINDLLSRPVSLWLADKQQRSAGLITEVFVMDNKGLNVAQSLATSDYWQGDEAKWKETYGNKSGSVHISEVEFDDSTGSYQSQVSMPVRNLETGKLIGAITFGVNVQSFL